MQVERDFTNTERVTHEEFKRRFVPLQQMLYREAFKVLGDRFEAEDAVQNLYVKLWEQKEEIGHIVSPEAYCRTMLRHICIDRWRRIRARDGDVEFVEETSEANAPPDAEGEATAEYLEHFLSTLPQRQRQVMRMTMTGNRTEEIAEATGLTVGNVKVIVSRIRKRFRELYYKR